MGQMMSDESNMGGAGSLPTAAPLSMPGVKKPWHEHVTQDLREQQVHKLVKAINPTADPASPRDIALACEVEGQMYESANSRDEYDRLLDENIYMIKKRQEEIRMCI